MEERKKFLEDSRYETEEIRMIHWSKDRLEEYFPDQNVGDITDLDFSTSYQYLIALNNNGFDSGEIDDFMEENDTYFLEVHISTEKPLIYMSYWKYLKGASPQDLETSVEAFLKEHEVFYDIFYKYAQDHDLIIINYDDLKLELEEDGKKVSLYYKYFNHFPKEPLVVPF